MSLTCCECGTTKNVKRIYDIPELVKLFEYEITDNTLLCPNCARLIAAAFRGEPFQFFSATRQCNFCHEPAVAIRHNDTGGYGFLCEAHARIYFGNY
jgi:hypothetical protein